MTSPTHDRILEVRGISKTYPGTVALEHVDLDIHPGEVVALLGENGAGKSTLSSIIAGVTVPSTGSMRWGGEDYAPGSPADAIAAGIGLIHQEMRLLPELTVAENVVIGRWPTRRGFVDAKAMRSRAEAQLARLGFTGTMDQRVSELSVAGQQQVEIAKALLLDASILILDEPTAALGQDETDALFACIRTLRAEGVSFVYVSHRLAEIAQIADRIVVLRDGSVISQHENGEVPPAQLVREMVGRSVDRLFPTIDVPRERVVLSVRGLRDGAGRFEDIDFDVREGEVFGIAGIVGSGRTELVRSIAGLEAREAGSVTVDGATLHADRPREAIRAGVVMIPEDRKNQGVILTESVESNIALSNLASLARGGWVAPKRVRAFARDTVKSFGIKAMPAQTVGSLSGGNQQKVVLGKWLARKTRVIILDEPTRGIDVGARASIYEIVQRLAHEGNAIVVVSSDLDEVIGLSHRIMVLAAGRNVGVLDDGHISAEAIMKYATGADYLPAVVDVSAS
ncbi:sugar ABC transporter ATP-binding protein [Herbiconiux moechotypicola]|uniref:Sugar ABC transporter ATP-binding protein n=1 Tax=Herbiconiux moechotypicola TaxID=637393 RepID=A0ABN3E833_9MICO|nr:sugar ABC transporter ATP-binding protein [Herbiconiux moechotypicola]MCS5732086.1 sugar ABC transporter ATP-binding protein [Herbiconiux moechotypicola]